MIDTRNLFEFVDYMRTHFKAGFNSIPTPNGMKVVGEYCTYAGQVMSVVIDVGRTRASLRIFDSARRLVYNTTSTTGKFHSNPRLLSFLQRSMSS